MEAKVEAYNQWLHVKSRDALSGSTILVVNVLVKSEVRLWQHVSWKGRLYYLTTKYVLICSVTLHVIY